MLPINQRAGRAACTIMASARTAGRSPRALAQLVSCAFSLRCQAQGFIGQRWRKNRQHNVAGHVHSITWMLPPLPPLPPCLSRSGLCLCMLCSQAGWIRTGVFNGIADRTDPSIAYRLRSTNRAGMACQETVADRAQVCKDAQAMDRHSICCRMGGGSAISVRRCARPRHRAPVRRRNRSERGRWRMSWRVCSLLWASAAGRARPSPARLYGTCKTSRHSSYMSTLRCMLASISSPCPTASQHTARLANTAPQLLPSFKVQHANTPSTPHKCPRSRLIKSSHTPEAAHNKQPPTPSPGPTPPQPAAGAAPRPQG